MIRISEIENYLGHKFTLFTGEQILSVTTHIWLRCEVCNTNALYDGDLLSYSFFDGNLNQLKTLSCSEIIIKNILE